jgi:hypothetical protein
MRLFFLPKIYNGCENDADIFIINFTVIGLVSGEK